MVVSLSQPPHPSTLTLQGHRDKDRETERETDGERERQTERETDGERDRRRERERQTERERETDGGREGWIEAVDILSLSERLPAPC